VETELAAAGLDLVFKDVSSIVDIKLNIATSPRVDDLTNISVLSIFNAGNSDFGSVEAPASTFAGSVNLKEIFVIKLFRIIIKLDSHGEGSAVTS